MNLASPALFANRGMIARQLGDAEGAIGFFERVLEDEPRHREAKRQLVLTLTDYDDAQQQQRAVELAESLVDDSAATARDVATLAWTLHRAGKEQQARQELEKALAAKSQDAETLFLSARLLMLLGDVERGRALATQLRERIDAVGLFVMRPQARQWLEKMQP